MLEVARRLVDGMWRTEVVDEPNGGGSTPGAVRWHGPYTFHYNDTGLDSGIAFYTPSVGDLLCDAWVLVHQAWDGTTPIGDLGTFVGTNDGLFTATNRPIDMTREKEVNYNGNGNDSQEGEPNSLVINNVFTLSSQVPRLVTAAYPFKFVVSQNGQKGGTSPGASQGRADIYICMSTPTVE